MIHFMNEKHLKPAIIDSVSHEPSAARAESCTCCGGGREPDPTDDNLRTLRRLGDLALAVAEKLAARILDEDAQQAAAPDEPGDAPKRHGQRSAAALAFQRIERGVRQCILLSNKLHDDRLARETQIAAASAKVEQQRRERRRSRVAHLVKEAIERDAEESGGDEYERLEKLDLRIDEEDIESDIGRIADSAIIARLCKDCGVEAPWKLWAGEQWALEEVRLKPPGSAYAGSPPAAPTEPGPQEVEPVGAKQSQPEPLHPKADEPAASAAKLPEPEPPRPEPDNPYEARMKARLAMALRSGAWMQALQTDPVLAVYVRSRLNNSS
jgi:hypothetical protein